MYLFVHYYCEKVLGKNWPLQKFSPPVFFSFLSRSISRFSKSCCTQLVLLLSIVFVTLDIRAVSHGQIWTFFPGNFCRFPCDIHFLRGQKPEKISIFPKVHVTRSKIWEIRQGNLKLQNFLKQKSRFFAPSFAFFKRWKKVFLTEIEIVLELYICSNKYLVLDSMQNPGIS